MNYGADLPGSGTDALESSIGGATKGVDAMGFSVNTLLAGITEMGGALDTLSKNPLMTYAFFEKVNNMWKHKYTNAVRDAVGMTDELQKKTLSYLSAVERGSAIVAAFTYNVGASAIEMRRAGIEFQKYANMPQLSAGGGNANIGARYQYAGAQATANYGSDFANIRQQLFKEVAGRVGFGNVNKNVIDAMASVQQTRGFNMGGTYGPLMEQYQNIEGMDSKKVMGLMLQTAQAVDEGKYSRGDPNQAFSSFFNNMSLYRGMDINVSESVALADLNSRLFGDNLDKDDNMRGLGLSGSMSTKLMQKFAINPADMSKRMAISSFLPGGTAATASRFGGGAYLADAVRDYIMDPQTLRDMGYNEGTIGSFGISKNMRTLQGENDKGSYAALMSKLSMFGLEKGDFQTLLGMKDIEFTTKELNNAAVNLNNASSVFESTAKGENEYTNNKADQLRKNASLMDRVSGLYQTVNTFVGQGGDYLDKNLGISSSDLQLLALGIGGPLAATASSNVLGWAGRQMGIQQPASGGSKEYVPTPGLSSRELRNEQAAFNKKQKARASGGFIKSGRWASGMKGMAGLTLLDAAMNFTDDTQSVGDASLNTLKTGAMLVGTQILLNTVTSIGTKVMAGGATAAAGTAATATGVVAAGAAAGIGIKYLKKSFDDYAISKLLDGEDTWEDNLYAAGMGMDMVMNSPIAGILGITGSSSKKSTWRSKNNRYMGMPVSPYRDANFAPSSPFMSDTMNDIFTTHKGLDKPFDFSKDMPKLKKKDKKELAGALDSTLNVVFSMGGSPLGSTAISPGQTESIMINVGGVLTG